MTKVEDAIVEIDAALAAMEAPHEGLRDFARLNISPDAKAAVDQAIAEYDERKRLLIRAKSGLTELMANGYPVLDIDAVSLSVKADLEANAATIEAALAKFSTNEAVTLGLGASGPEPK